MPAVDLTPYNQPQGSTSDGTKYVNALALIQSTLNGIDNNNFAAGKIFDPSKLMQNSAVDGDGLVYDGVSGTWKRTTDKPLRIAALAGYPADATKALFGDGTWKVPSASAGVGTELDYKQITADAATTTHTTEGTADTIIDGNLVTYDGTKVKVEIFAAQILNVGGATGPATAVLLRDSTVIGQVALTQGLGVTSAGSHAYAVTYDTPSAAAHTYKWHLFGGGTATYTVKAGAGVSGALTPAFIRVTKA